MPNTSNRAYPYPAQVDPPAGHTQIQALAEAVDSDMNTQMSRITSLETGAGLKALRYYSTNAQALSAATNTVLAYTTIDYAYNSPATYNGSGVFTLAATGLWAISANVQFTTGGAAYIWIGHGTNTTALDRYAISVTQAAGISAHSLYTEKRFSAGATVALWAWGQSGTVQTLTTEYDTAITLRFLGNPA